MQDVHLLLLSTTESVVQDDEFVEMSERFDIKLSFECSWMNSHVQEYFSKSQHKYALQSLADNHYIHDEGTRDNIVYFRCYKMVANFCHGQEGSDNDLFYLYSCLVTVFMYDFLLTTLPWKLC